MSRFVPTSLCLLAATLLLAGCGEEKIYRPGADGRIAGRVLGPDGPVEDMRVHVESADPGLGYDLRGEAQTDTAGRYEFPLPAGAYLLEVRPSDYGWYAWQSRSGLTFLYEQAETLRVVRNETTVVDFVVGAVSIDIEPPDETGDFRIIGSLYVAATGKHVATVYPIAGSSPPVSFRLGSFPPFAYRISLEIDPSSYSGESTVWLAAALSAAEADSFLVEPLKTTYVQKTLPEPGRLQGQVTGCWDVVDTDPPSVHAYAASDEQVAYASVSDDGRFDIPIFAPGTVRLRLYRHWSSGAWIGGATYEEATEFRVDMGTITDVEPILSGCVLCRVEDPPTSAYSSARLSLYAANSAEVVSSTNSSSGHFATFEGLDLGTYFLKVTGFADAAWRPQWYDRSATREGATPIVIEGGGDVADITITLEEGGRILGHAWNDEAPRTEVEVSAVRVDGSWEFGWNDAGPDGAFELPGLPDGDYRVRARGHADDRHRWYPGTAIEDSAEIITILNACEVDSIDWEI
jgi:hypothetical protein